MAKNPDECREPLLKTQDVVLEMEDLKPSGVTEPTQTDDERKPLLNTENVDPNTVVEELGPAEQSVENETSQTIDDLRQQLVRRDKELEDRDIQLKKKNIELEDKDIQLEERNKELAKKDKQLAELVAKNQLVERLAEFKIQQEAIIQQTETLLKGI